MKKQIISLLVAAVVLVATMIPAFAVTEITSQEQAVLDMLDAGLKIGDKTLDLSAYTSKARNYFLENDNLDTDAELQEIKDAAAALASQLAEYNVTVSADGKYLDKSKANTNGATMIAKCLEIINGVANKYGITATYNTTNDVVSLTGDGVDFSTYDLIKQTGAESMVVPFAVGAVLVVALIGTSMFVFNKTKRSEA